MISAFHISAFYFVLAISEFLLSVFLITMPIGTIEQAVHLWARLRTRLFTLLLATQFRDFGAGSRISPPFRFHGLNQMSVGKGVMIHRDSWLQTIQDEDNGKGVKLIIKSHAAIGMGAHISAAKQVLIEEHVLLARNVYISDHAHAFEKVDVPIVDQGLNRIAPVTIGRETWLGQNVVVLPGVAIGKHCVIGANSVVNSAIPNYCVAVGAPARVVKRLNENTGGWEHVC